MVRAVSWQRLFTIAVVALLLVLQTPHHSVAQSSEIPPVTRTFVIQNATIIPSPGEVIEGGSVLIRDGLIQAVGASVTVPFDAQVIDGDSMYVYAGFIDGLSYTGVPKPKEDTNRPRVDDPGNPPDDLAGIQPQRDVRTFLDADDKSVADLREAGFGAAHVVPHGRMLPGMGSLILLGGEHPDALVLKGETSQFAQFATARGMYPGTPMGIMAKYRQLYREAERRQRMEMLYAENPVGITRPSYDDVHYAFFPVLSQEQPVFFYTDSALETFRAMSLQRELGFNLVLAGMEQSYDLLDDLERANLPMFLTLDLPRDPKWMAKIEADSLEQLMASYDPAERTATYRDLEAERRNLEALQLRSRQNYLRTAAMMHERGLDFGFMTMDVKANAIHKNLRTMIEEGLPEDAALAALTTTPAELLGVSNMLGSVATGKIANLVVTTAPYFDEDAQIKYVFVDGVQYEYEIKSTSAASGDPSAEANAVGVWSYNVETPQGDIGGTLTITGSPGSLSGTISNDMMPDATDLDEVSLTGNELTVSFSNPDMGTINISVVITGDDFEGSLSVPNFGDLPMTGSRTGSPE